MSKKKQTITPEYLAGSLDRRGTFTMDVRRTPFKTYNCQAFVEIRSLSQSFLRQVQKIYGGSISKSPSHFKVRNWKKKAHRLIIMQQTELFKLVKDILPYMVIKRDKIQVLHDFLKLRLQHTHKKYTKKELTLAFTYKAMHNLW